MKNTNTDPLNSVFDHIFGKTVGFDDFENMFKTVSRTVDNAGKISSFPFYDIYRIDKKAFIELALAGYTKDDLTVSTFNNKLTIATKPDMKTFNDDSTGEDPTRSYRHRGISKKKFEKIFTIAPDMTIEKVDFVDGLLRIEIMDNTEEPKKQEININ